MNLKISSNQPKVLVVGKNSTIVKSIEQDICGFYIVSHEEVDLIDIESYDYIFLFSWNHLSNNDNIKILNKFSLDRVIFISTISVLACALRPQWASYPNAKLTCENIVLAGGGKVIRIGVWDLSLIKYLFGSIPVTTPKTLVDSMYESLISNKRIFWPFIMRSGELSGIKLYLSNYLNQLSHVLPAMKFIQIPIAIVSKLLGSKDYGYTHDCLKFFSQRVLVGFGAVGSVVSEELDLKGHCHSIIVSREQNIFLNSKGFIGMRLGQYKEGLSRLWHGVWIEKRDRDSLYKKVPIFVRRPSAPRKTIFGTVTSIDFGRPMPSVIIKHTEVSDVRVFSEVIHLAAGVINNIKILQGAYSIKGIFSDHEVVDLGVIDTEDLIIHRLIVRRFGFVYGRKVIQGRSNGLEYMIDFRPEAVNSIAIDSENIYNNRGQQIVKKLIKNFSLKLINQAFFNKFGLALDVGLFSVNVQIDVPGCIKLDSDGGLTRDRLSLNVLDSIADTISLQFKSFEKSNILRTFDAIHVHGGFNLDEFPELRKYIDGKLLFLHGNALNASILGPFHNTVSMINREREVVKNV
jgi:hypothetical protein